jgi:hypothetical protein
MTQEIDPRFFIPPYVTGIEYSDNNYPSSDAPIQDGDDPTVIIDYDSNIEDPNASPDAPSGAESEERLLPPDYITIVSQTSRVTPGGMVVDVVIDIEDIARVSQFEVRVTK